MSGQSLFVIATIVGHAVFLQWVSSRWQTRQGTFFSVRVEPDFAKSDVARAILRGFWRRIWLWAFAIYGFYGVSFWLESSHGALWRWGMITLIMIGDVEAFSTASRETRAKAVPRREPQLRTAELFTEDAERSLGLAL